MSCDNAPPTVTCPAPPASRLPEPVTERAVSLRLKMGPERWAREVKKSQWCLGVVRGVKRLHRRGHGSRGACLRKVGPGVPWSTYCYWRRLVGTREGPEWERLLDGRVPRHKEPVDPEIRSAAELLRRVDSQMGYQTAREHLGHPDQFGAAGRVSDATLGRIWRRAGLTNPEAGDPGRFEKVEYFPGGAAVALVGAAAAESGVAEALAGAALEAGRVVAEAQEGGEPSDPHPGRDEKGRFTADYNHAVRQSVEPGQADSRWDSDRVKRERRDLSSLSVLHLAPETLAQRLLVMGMWPMVTDLRGFDGLEAPRAQWLSVSGRKTPSAATLDKTLAELALLGVDEALWDKHGELWVEKAREWAGGGPHWATLIRHLDITAEPHWTDRFALSGKVSRTGRVQPCLQRVCVTVYPGVPVRMRTLAGTQSLRKHLREMLAEEAAEATQEGTPKRFWLTVVDGEAGEARLLKELCELPDHAFITVLKGKIREGAKILETGPWEPYRKRDRIREVLVEVHGKGVPAGDLVLRGVQMDRKDTRHPHQTIFVTDAARKFLSTEEVPDAYLSRWPHEEQVFRKSRHGAGLERSCGYTGEYIAHVTLEGKQEKAQRRVERTDKEIERARIRSEDAQEFQRTAKGTSLGVPATLMAEEAARKVRQAEDRNEAAVEQAKRLDTMPRTIFQRDTTRENVVTAATMSVMMLVEWVLREYFGGCRMELATFLEWFLYLPVEVRTTWSRELYRIETQALPADKTDLLRQACEEITRRRIRRSGRRLEFEVVDTLTKSRDHP